MPADLDERRSTYTTDEVAELTGFSRWLLYDEKRIQLPDGTTVQPIICRRRVLWPAAPIDAGLGLDQATNGRTLEARRASEPARPDTDSGAPTRQHPAEPGAACDRHHDQVTGDGTRPL